MSSDTLPRVPLQAARLDHDRLDVELVEAVLEAGIDGPLLTASEAYRPISLDTGPRARTAPMSWAIFSATTTRRMGLLGNRFQISGIGTGIRHQG
jgi:hypothetical protein